jgi:hypothetical protein
LKFKVKEEFFQFISDFLFEKLYFDKRENKIKNKYQKDFCCLNLYFNHSEKSDL